MLLEAAVYFCCRPSGSIQTEKPLRGSNVSSCSRDVRQRKQQTGPHWTGIDTELGGALMSREAVFSFFLFTFSCSSSVHIKQRRQWEGALSSSTSTLWASGGSGAEGRGFDPCSVILLSIPVWGDKAPGWPLTSGLSKLRYAVFSTWLWNDCSV